MKTSLVTDPWFSLHGAFLASWAQFPCNEHLDTESIRNSDYIFVSHEHEDHLDLDFLRTCSPSTMILIPDYPSQRAWRRLTGGLPNEVRVLAERQRIALSGDLTITLVKQSVPIWDDCTIIVETGDLTIANSNDMKITPSDAAWIRDQFDIDYLFLQFSGATWYPIAYDYPPAKKRKIAQQKIANKFTNTLAIADAVGARYIVPTAGPPCFLDDSLFHLNFAEYSIFPSQHEFFEFARGRGEEGRLVVPLPGEEMVDPPVPARSRNNFDAAHFVDRCTYLEEYRDRRRPHIQRRLARIPPSTESLLDRASPYFSSTMRSSHWLTQKIGGSIRLELTGTHPEDLVVDFSNPDDPVRDYDGQPCLYRMRTEARFVREVFEGNIGWEDLLLSMRMSMSRRPDVYNEYLTVFLRYANEAQFRLIEAYETREVPDQTFEMVYADKRLEVQRHCPHTGGDLARGMVVDGQLVCPVHGWQFSLDTGEGSIPGYCITIRELPNSRPSS